MVDDVGEVGLDTPGLEWGWCPERRAERATQRERVRSAEEDREFRVQGIADALPVVLVAQSAGGFQSRRQGHPDLAVRGEDVILGLIVGIADQEREAVLAGEGVVGEGQRLVAVLGADREPRPVAGQKPR